MNNAEIPATSAPITVVSTDRFAQWFPKIDTWDKKIIQTVYQKYAGTIIRPIARIVSICGDPKLWLPTLIITFIVGWYQKDLKLWLYLSTAFFQSYAIYYIVKQILKRPRPFAQFGSISSLDRTGHGYSFPSGHAHHSTILVGFLWLYFYPVPWLLPIILTYNVIVGFSRLISGVHFPSDTIVGIIAGYVMLAFHWFITKDLYLIIVQMLGILPTYF
jgi:undecaprenyl-diphosphatase